MKLFELLDMDASCQIDWEMTPIDTFAMFESRGGKARVRSHEERYYYFAIDCWQSPARLWLVERGIRHAIELAEIKAPLDLMNQCIHEQGAALKEKSYAINGNLRHWLEENVVDDGTGEFIVPRRMEVNRRNNNILPSLSEVGLETVTKLDLRKEGRVLAEDYIAQRVKQYNFFERTLNPSGRPAGLLVQGNAAGTAYDISTGLYWQQRGCDHGSFHRLRKSITGLNQEQFGGHRGWRLPTVDEVLSLLEPAKNTAGLHIHPYFDPAIGYVYTADRHKPGGYWFVDFRQAKVFWAGGTFSGGFARLCCDCRVVSEAAMNTGVRACSQVSGLPA